MAKPIFSRMRANKALVREALDAPDWRERLERLTADAPQSFVGPLMSCLALGGTQAGRAAAALGACVAAIAEQAPEEARGIMRRFMWQMNEDSGNLGWGVPESMAETLARSDLLAGEFWRVLFSYIRDTGREDNFVDHAPLRRSCYWAVGRVIRARPELAASALPLLRAGLGDGDVPCRGMAAWAIAQVGSMPVCRDSAAVAIRKRAKPANGYRTSSGFVFCSGHVPEEYTPVAKNSHSSSDGKPARYQELRLELEQLAAAGESAHTPVQVFDGELVREYTIADLAGLALAKLSGQA
jgi:hypothetical protein